MIDSRNVGSRPGAPKQIGRDHIIGRSETGFAVMHQLERKLDLMTQLSARSAPRTTRRSITERSSQEACSHEPTD
jgi:hypothetical protein